jgi:hypothetical protein
MAGAFAWTCIIYNKKKKEEKEVERIKDDAAQEEHGNQHTHIEQSKA